jgi:hypothetical protein
MSPWCHSMKTPIVPQNKMTCTKNWRKWPDRASKILTHCLRVLQGKLGRWIWLHNNQATLGRRQGKWSKETLNARRITWMFLTIMWLMMTIHLIWVSL